jgi:hypothetical protein
MICVLGVFVVANVAGAASVALRHSGIVNDEFTMALNTSDTLELWITFTDLASGNANVGDGGQAVWISSGIQLQSLMGSPLNDPLPANPHVEWDSGGAGDGGVASPGGLNINGRIGTAGTKDFDDYNLIYQDAVEGDFNIMVITDGWSSANGLVFHADDIKIDAKVETAAGEWQKVYHPGGDALPAWDEGRVYANDVPNVNGFRAQDIGMVLTSKKKALNNIRIHVTPEPASVAMLALGGLAVFRRRR